MRVAPIIDDELPVTGAAFSAIKVRIWPPVEHANGHLACDFQLVAGDWSEAFHIYGGDSLQAVLLTLSHVADLVAGLLAERGGHIESVVWEDLRRLCSTEEERNAAHSTLLRVPRQE